MKLSKLNLLLVFNNFYAKILLWVSIYTFHSLCLTGQGRTRDLILDYSKSNEYLFWHQVSLFYPWSEEQIIQYKEQLIPYKLTANQNIKWNADMIRAIPIRTGFDLMTNPAIFWNQTLINEFHNYKWFDWDYITNNNRKVTLSRSFFASIKHHLPPHFVIDSTRVLDSIVLSSPWFSSPPLTVFASYLKTYNDQGQPIQTTSIPSANNEIQLIPADTLLKYYKIIDWFRLSKCQFCQWSFEDIEKLFPFFPPGQIAANKAIYDTLFTGILNDRFLEEVAAYHYPKAKIRYYHLGYSSDDYGSAASISFYGDRNKSFIDKMNLENAFPDTLVKSKYVLSGYWGNLLRFSDVHQFNSTGYPSEFSLLIVSYRTQLILKDCKLPPHRFYPITVYNDDPWYGKDTMSYYLLLLDRTPIDQVITDSLFLSRRNNMYGEYVSFMDTTYGSFYQHRSYRWYIDSLTRNGVNRELHVPRLYLASYYDLFTLGNEQFFVSPRLKTALENARINGIYLRHESRSPVVYIEKDLAPRHEIDFNRSLDLEGDIIDQRAIKNFKILSAKRDSILSKRPVLDSIYRSKPYPPYIQDGRKLQQRDSLLRQFEIKHDILLPSKYRKALITGNIPKPEISQSKYTFLPLEYIQQFDNGWHSTTPFLVKGIIIASDGEGNWLAMLLDENSTYKLNPVVYKVEQGANKVTPLFDIRDRLL